MRRRRAKAYGFAVVMGVGLPLSLLLPVSAQEQTITLIAVDGPITPVVADYVADALHAAEDDGSQALVLTLDTPGGLDTSMRDIVQAFLNAELPVIVYVSPEGARAASAGTFMTMAAHIAAMAPATSIGAATPVDLQGGEITDKVINDAAAFAVSVAERRNRDVGFAEQAVRGGRSITSREAVEAGVVDLIADDLDELLVEVDGMEIESLGWVLNTENALVMRREMGRFRSVLGSLADPNLAFIFLSIGTLAVIYEAANPGLGFAGIAGVILLVLAFFALSVLPVRGAGIALLILGIGLLVAELFVPGIGVLAAGGTIALVLSGLFLFEGDVRVDPSVLWPSAVVLGASSLIAGRAVFKARNEPPTSGPETMIGKTVKVTQNGNRRSVFLEGAWWEVVARRGELKPGSLAKVVAIEGLRLVVEEVDDGV